MILFGSLVTGEVGEWSDIDLIVVQDTQQPFWKRLHELRMLLRPRVGLDLLVYTPQEFGQLKRERPFFRNEILSRGRIVYER